MFIKKSPRKVPNTFSNTPLWSPLLQQYKYLIPNYKTNYQYLYYNKLRTVAFSPVNTLASYTAICLELEAGPRETGLLKWVLAGHSHLEALQRLSCKRLTLAASVDEAEEVEVNLTRIAITYMEEIDFFDASGFNQLPAADWALFAVVRPTSLQVQSLKRKISTCVEFRDLEVSGYNSLMPVIAELGCCSSSLLRRLYPTPGTPIEGFRAGSGVALTSIDWPHAYLIPSTDSVSTQGKGVLNSNLRRIVDPSYYEGLTSLNSENTLADIVESSFGGNDSLDPWSFCDTPEGKAYFKELGEVFPLFKTRESLRKRITRPRKKDPLPYSPTSDDDDVSPVWRLSFLAALEPFLFSKSTVAPWATHPHTSRYRMNNLLLPHQVVRRSLLGSAPEDSLPTSTPHHYLVFKLWGHLSDYKPLPLCKRGDPRWRGLSRLVDEYLMGMGGKRRIVASIFWSFIASVVSIERKFSAGVVQYWWEMFDNLYFSLQVYKIFKKKPLQFGYLQSNWVRHFQETYCFSAHTAMYPLYSSLHFYSVFTQYHLRHLALCVAGRFVRAHYKKAQYNFYWNFQGRRLFLTLHNDGDERYNYFFLSLGLFLKFFRYKKCLKKTKLMKLLLVKYARKLFIVAGIEEINFWVRGVPALFTELLRVFFTPVITPFRHPLTMQPYHDVEETKKKTPFFPVSITHNRSKPYNYMKVKRRGRLKRKIMRRLVSKSRVCD